MRKKLVSEREDRLEQIFEEVFSTEKLGIKLFKGKVCYENAKRLWELGEIIEDLHEDIIMTEAWQLDSASLVLQSLAYYKPWESGMEKDEVGFTYLMRHKTWQDYMIKYVEMYRENAKVGDAKAQFMMGHFYYYGMGVEQDYAEAIKQWRRAAKQGHIGAKCYLGKCYFQRNGSESKVLENQTEAMALWKEAAYRGNVKAQYFIDKYEKGKKVCNSY